MERILLLTYHITKIIFVLFRHDHRGDEDGFRQEGLAARVGRHEDAGAASQRRQASGMLH
jgi:hypothetical protein